MKKSILLLSLIALIGNAFSQSQCDATVPPAVSGAVYHIQSNTTIANTPGEVFYVCSGVTLTVEYSEGSEYMLEDGATLIITDHEGDYITAKGNCTITDYSTEALVVATESTTSISKPNNGTMLFLTTCPTVTFDYSNVGGSAPCGTSSIEENTVNVVLYPNPVQSGSEINFDANIDGFMLFDQVGRMVYQTEEVANSFALPKLSTGKYLLIGKDGENIFRTNLSIQ